eukprot:GHRR01005304.1.p1 GENE.GHRR01005304.1~~GHRR01005304.1.p1  ORF type:complete len:162 (+),score=10.90 GHRR01005304.1:1786-2271(+)
MLQAAYTTGQNQVLLIMAAGTKAQHSVSICYQLDCTRHCVYPHVESNSERSKSNCSAVLVTLGLFSPHFQPDHACTAWTPFCFQTVCPLLMGSFCVQSFYSYYITQSVCALHSPAVQSQGTLENQLLCVDAMPLYSLMIGIYDLSSRLLWSSMSIAVLEVL